MFKVVKFPVCPYLGQIFYHTETKRTFEFCEFTKVNPETQKLYEGVDWFDITDKDLAP